MRNYGRGFSTGLDFAPTHVVPLVEVHGAGDRGEALIAVVAVRVQSGCHTEITGRVGGKQSKG